MKLKLLILLSCFLFISEFSIAQNWRDIKTVEDICTAQPQTIKTLLDQIDLDYPGMEKVKAASESGNLIIASSELLNYYKSGNTADYLRKEQPVKSQRNVAEADTTLKNVFIVQNVRGEVPWLEDGHRDWYYKGPNTDREWAWLSNRHTQLLGVFEDYFETGNPKYAIYIDEFLRDFILKSMPYPAKKGRESIWRGLEVAARAKVWSQVFYGFLNSEYMHDATLLLMLSSLSDHAHYNRNFHGGNNWLTMEISALATVATNWPEYKASEEWLDYSIETISESMRGQVYADGTQTELTSHYHNVAMRNFVLFKEICDRVNAKLPDFFNETIEKMYSYIAHVVRPDGNRILNNDGDRGSDVALILKGAETYQKPEWKYAATNGSQGIKPKAEPSVFYNWAGQLISRNGYHKDAHWSFYDVGPWGSGHQHNDKLHISISAYGRDLLVDAGRFAYTGEVAQKFRSYAKGTQGHNTILFDGKGQEPDTRVIDEPLSKKHWKITPDYDYTWNSFDKYIDVQNVKHSRSLMYVRDEFWVVVDKVETDQPRTIQALWHFHPACEVYKRINGIVATENEKGNLKIMPVNKKLDWKIDVVEGQEEPEIQGWYSPEYNKFEPNKAFIYSTEIEEAETFVWLLIPSESDAPELDCKVVSRNNDGVELEITSNKGTWNLMVPYSDSAQTKFKYSK